MTSNTICITLEKDSTWTICFQLDCEMSLVAGLKSKEELAFILLQRIEK